MSVFIVAVDDRRDDDVRNALDSIRGAPSANTLTLREGAVFWCRTDTALPDTDMGVVEFLDSVQLVTP
jgi:hypothetical protein